jgi:hypothetical protein
MIHLQSSQAECLRCHLVKARPERGILPTGECGRCIGRRLPVLCSCLEEQVKGRALQERYSRQSHPWNLPRAPLPAILGKKAMQSYKFVTFKSPTCKSSVIKVLISGPTEPSGESAPTMSECLKLNGPESLLGAELSSLSVTRLDCPSPRPCACPFPAPSVA